MFAGLLVVLAVVLLSASTASARRGRVFGPSFGSPGSGAGQLSFLSSQTGASAIRTNLAVNDMTHDVYVADPGNHRVDEFEANGTFVRAWGWGVRDGAAEFQVCTTQTTCREGLSGVAPGEFMTPAFVAVDNSSGSSSGDVYVGDATGGTVAKFTQAGQIVESWGAKGQMSAATGAGTGTLTNGSNTIESVTTTAGAFTRGQVISGAGIPTGSEITSVNGGTIEVSKPASTSGAVALTAEGVFGRIQGVTVGLPGELWISATDFGPNFGYKFDSDGTYKSEFHGTEGEYSPQGMALNSLDELYYVQNGIEVWKRNAAGEQLGRITPLGGIGVQPVTGIVVNPVTDELYVDIDEGREIEILSASCMPTTSAFGPFCAPSVTFSAPGLVGGAGLAIDTSSGSASSEALYIVETAADKIERIVPEPPAAPLVEEGSQTVSDVSGDSATLEAAVNPRSEPSEEPTSYRFQYTTDEQFQREGFTGASTIPVPDGQLAPSYESDPISARPQGLTPDTVYRYRVVAENAISRKEGRPTEGEREGAGEEIVRTFTTQPLGVFSLPDGRAWELVSPPDKHGALMSALYSVEVAQASADGDAVTYLASAPTELGAPGNAGETQVLSARTVGSWLSQDISTPHDAADGAVGNSSEYRFFSPDLSLGITQINGQGKSVPALSSEASEMTPFLRNSYAGGDHEDLCARSCYMPLVTGAPGFANVPEGTEFGKAPCSEVECGPHFEGGSPDGNHFVLQSKVPLIEGAPAFSIYEWNEDQLQLISVLPGGEPAPESSDPRLGSVSGEEGGTPSPVTGNTIATDGSRVLWSTGGGAGKRLYVRDVVREETVELGGPEARFQTASADGSRVFFTGGSDLWVFEAASDAALSTGHATDLTPGGGLRGLVSSISRDGSSVYFVANTVLTSGVSAGGEHALASQPNLYIYRAGEIKLVAVLSGDDRPDWGVTSANMTTARVSPDGRWLAFMSERPLTGYDNRDVTTGERDEEVFLYDATANGGEGRLVCASCNLTGARPHGIIASNTLAAPTLFDKQFAWAGHRIAANVPAWTSPLYQSRYLSDSGRLFFNSADALAPSDTNGTVDVYEYEPFGVGGGCLDAGVGFGARSGGCVDLVSSGTAKEESAFIDASENGDDVFFLTAARLSRQDTDSVLDVYDARVGGGFPAPQPPPSCEGDACQSPVAAPTDPTPGSLTYRGPGNPGPLLTAQKASRRTVKCVKRKQVKHGKCVRSKVKAKKARRAGKTVGAGAKRRVK